MQWKHGRGVTAEVNSEIGLRKGGQVGQCECKDGRENLQLKCLNKVE